MDLFESLMTLKESMSDDIRSLISNINTKVDELKQLIKRSDELFTHIEDKKENKPLFNTTLDKCSNVEGYTEERFEEFKDDVFTFFFDKVKSITYEDVDNVFDFRRDDTEFNFETSYSILTNEMSNVTNMQEFLNILINDDFLENNEYDLIIASIKGEKLEYDSLLAQYNKSSDDNLDNIKDDLEWLIKGLTELEKTTSSEFICIDKIIAEYNNIKVNQEKMFKSFLENN